MTNAPERIYAKYSDAEPYNGKRGLIIDDEPFEGSQEFFRRPRVKPLVWREYSNNGNCMAETSIGDYVIEDHGENDWGIWLEDNYSPILGPYKTLEEAKDAAQSDCERRILEALE